MLKMAEVFLGFCRNGKNGEARKIERYSFSGHD